MIFGLSKGDMFSDEKTKLKKKILDVIIEEYKEITNLKSIARDIFT